MQRINDISLTPPGGWAVRLSTKEKIEAGTLPALCKEIFAHPRAQAEGLTTPLQVEACICRQVMTRYPAATTCDSQDRPSFPDIEAVDTSGSKEQWGSRMWDLIHRKKIEEEENPGQWLRRFHERLECPICRNHFHDLIQQNPPRYGDWLAWTWTIHQAVNKSLGRAGISLEEARVLHEK